MARIKTLAKDVRDWVEWTRTVAARRFRLRPASGDVLKTLLSDVPSLLGPAEATWLAQRATEAAGDIIELDAGLGYATCALARGARSNRVAVLWPSSVGDCRSSMRRAFAAWQQTVIRKELVPAVWPVSVSTVDDIADALKAASLVGIGLGRTPAESRSEAPVSISLAKYDALSIERVVSSLPKGCVVVWMAHADHGDLDVGSPLRVTLGATSRVGALEWGVVQ